LKDLFILSKGILLQSIYTYYLKLHMLGHSCTVIRHVANWIFSCNEAFVFFGFALVVICDVLV